MAFLQNHERDLVFLDSETTGLDPLYNEAIEWAAIRVGPDGTEKEAFEAKVKPLFPERFDTKAREVNG
jgi:DNA polymerase III epsilon subunit-like protein